MAMGILKISALQNHQPRPSQSVASSAEQTCTDENACGAQLLDSSVAMLQMLSYG
jgi:hypothetical protein